MDVASLVAKLGPLLADPRRDSDAILELLAKARRLADFEVARFLVTKHTEPLVRELLASPDPRERRRAVRWVELTFVRGPAALVLRTATKDRSTMVRRAAMSATRALRLDDVALPDTRGTKQKALPPLVRRNPFTGAVQTFPAKPATIRSRGWNPTGWRFGLYPPPKRQRRPSPALSELETREDVETLLGIDHAALSALLRPGAGPGKPYVAFEIPKATGGSRVIHAPRAPLKRLQRAVLRLLLAEIEPHAAAHGFVPGRSVVTNASAHVGARIVVKMDLVDFFPTIHYGRLAGLFRQHGAKKEAAAALAAIVTWREELPDGRIAWPSVLPQGAPTSPALSNLVCRRLDARLSALATTVGARYTRYADDLTFSFANEPEKGLGRFLWWVNQIISQEGFAENLKKRRVLRPSSQQRVTGVVTNTRMAVPREARRRFRAVLHACKRLGVTKEATRHEEPRAYLLGFASWVAMVQPELGEKLRGEVAALLAP